MCNVKAEDAGEIRFAARDVESIAYLEVEGRSARMCNPKFKKKNGIQSSLTARLPVSELPVSIVKPLRDRTALEKHRVILECTVSSARCSATWYKDGKEVVPSGRVEILDDGCSLKLVIQEVAVEDEGTYSVEVGEHTCKAKLMVEGKPLETPSGDTFLPRVVEFGHILTSPHCSHI